MIMKTITYKNFLDQEETGDFYFNMSKGELVKQQMAAINQHTESFQDKLEKIGKNLQGEALVAVLDEIILDSYGELSTDKKNFVKVRSGQKVVENFMSSGAYSELVVELCTTTDAMAEFINGIMPADLRDAVNKEVATTRASQNSHAEEQARIRAEIERTGRGFAPPAGARVPLDFQRKQEAPKPTLTTVAEVPTVIEGTADPVLEAQPAMAPFNQHVSTDLSTAELEAMLEARRSV